MFEESLSESWRRRYGCEPQDVPGAVAPFLVHRSVREFAHETVPEPVVRGLVAAAQSAATSSNLQLWSVVSVQDPARRAAVAKLCGGQKHILEAAWFFAFVADMARCERVSRAAGVEPAALETVEMYTMAVVDAALAAERMACAAEAQGLGICYIGALRNDPPAVRDLLRLPAKTFAVFGFCIGRPAEPCRAEIKPRLAQDAVWFREGYDPAPDVAEYDARMKPFYESQGQKSDVTWTMRSARRVDGSAQQMGGRERQMEFLRGQGLNLR
jgi:nitroreductase